MRLTEAAGCFQSSWGEVALWMGIVAVPAVVLKRVVDWKRSSPGVRSADGHAGYP